jgi:hypothetical protein
MHIEQDSDGVVIGEPPVRPIEGVREYWHMDSDLLFVVYELPPKHAPEQHLFGRSTPKVFQTMREAGLIDCAADDPFETERAIFEIGSQPGFSKASVAQLVRSSVVTGRYRVVIHEWIRIMRMVQLLNAQKLVLVGSEVRRSLNQRSLHRFPNAYGYLGVYAEDGIPVPTYGVHLRGGRIDDWRTLKAI